MGVCPKRNTSPESPLPLSGTSRALNASQPHNGTYLGKALGEIDEKYDRLIVITDEQSHDSVPNPKARGYVINVASFQNGVGYGKWMHIDGWSDSVIEYIRAAEPSLE